MRRHSKRLHTENKIKCPVCEKELRNRPALLSHMRVHKEPTHKCSICDKMFASPLGLRVIVGHLEK